MFSSVGLLALALVLQVPPPDTAVKESDVLRRLERASLDREAARLSGLADRLASRGDEKGAAEVRRNLPPPPPAAGASRYVPLAEVVSLGRKGLANTPAEGQVAPPWKAELEAIRFETAEELRRLASRAAKSVPRHYALADACLRAALARQPDHAEARRLLGFVSHEGGWATPFAVSQLRGGRVLHPIYGWVEANWVPHLEKGELPSRPDLVRDQVEWVSTEQADAERSEFPRGWEIRTEHFFIKTNVPLSEAIRFGRHLETLYQLFQSLLADVIGENLPLAQRYKTKTSAGLVDYTLHSISYFASKKQFADYLRPQEPDIDQSLGLYLPPKNGWLGHAYFYRDQGGDIAVTATLYHEVSHQLLFESGIARPDAYRQNHGNYWVFEGLGTYFETLILDKSGNVEIGGLVGPRIAEAQKSLVTNGQLIPLAQFVRYNKERFNRQTDIYLHYQQAIALATFLMQARDGAYREGFLEYVKSACQGRLKANSGRPLNSRVGKSYAEIEAELLAYLKEGGGGAGD